MRMDGNRDFPKTNPIRLDEAEIDERGKQTVLLRL